jgi:hypothetical protein
MNEIKKLYQLMEQMRKEINDLKRQVSQRSEFSSTFSGKQIINHEVQFLQKVRDKDGNVVTEINP